MDPSAWAWDVEAFVVVPLLVLGYAVAVRGIPVPRWRVTCFAGSVALIAVVLVSPLETLALHFLLSAHLLQNVVLAEWAPVLCVLGVPAGVAAAASSRTLVRLLTRPVIALPVWLGTYFVWHVPALYNAALRNASSLLHLEHASYFVAGCLLWWPVFQARPHELTSGAKAGYLFAAFVLASPLGLLLALLPSPVYDFYERRPRIWGLSALTDQQLAGVTMAGEQAVVFFALFLVFLLRFLAEEEQASEPSSSSS